MRERERGPFGVPYSKDYVADGQGWDGGFQGGWAYVVTTGAT